MGLDCGYSSLLRFSKKTFTAAPVTKITGFGGDYSLAENTYGHLYLARKSIARVLSDLESDRYFDLEEAVQVGEYLLRKSVERIYPKHG